MEASDVKTGERPTWKDRITLRMDAEFAADLDKIGVDSGKVTGADIKRYVRRQAEGASDVAPAASDGAKSDVSMASDAGLTWAEQFYALFLSMPETILELVTPEQMDMVQKYEEVRKHESK